MSRTVRYILIIILIAAAAMWVLTVYRSCQTAKKENTESTTNGSTTGDTNSATEDANNTTSLEDLYEDEDNDSTNIAGNTGDSLDDDSDEAEEDTITDEDIRRSGVLDDDAFENKSGNYLVVAGAFVAKSNADSYQRQLKKKGYDPEVRIFLGSDYHSVILGDYATEAEALSVAKKLGAEAYVHKRRFPKKR